MPERLDQRSCRPLTPGSPPLTDAQARQFLSELPGWSVEGGKLTKTFSFKDHYQTTAFANAIFWISHRQDHHPDLSIGYNKLTVRYDTHSIGGLSDNDFICAARVEALL
jgi:4a-hydroxytetrahydrobiopterin dehydratase